MTCLAAHQIAEAATTDEVDAHFAGCLACRRELDSQRSVRAALRRMPVPAMAPGRRRELAAETIARAERARPVAALRWTRPASLAAAAALVLVLVLARQRGVTSAAAEMPQLVAQEHVSTSDRQVAHEQAPPALPSPRIDAGAGTRVSHQVGDDRDLLTIIDGTLAIDTRAARDVDVRIGTATVRVVDANVQIHARQGKIISVHVIVGSAQIISADQHVVIERSSIWRAEPVGSERSLRAFREAWIALRSGHNREAIELFDAATDATVAEEATYWAAIATKRVGDNELARQRFAEFLERFPSSLYAAQARQLAGE